MRFDIAFSDATYVVYFSCRDDYFSPSSSTFMCPGTYVE
jgi:hypothetical protein